MRSTPAAIGLLLVFACGCSSRAVDDGDTGTGTDGDTGGDPSAPTTGDPEPGGHGIALSVNRDVDILFVLDNSGSMGEEQALLSHNIPAFIDVLEADAQVNYRIGVTTTDNGNPACGPSSPEAGALQMSSCLARTSEFVFSGTPPADATTACTDLCIHDTITTVPTTTELDPEAKPRPWLESTEGRTNLAEVGGVLPTAVEAFQCFGPQGIAGCGFESHLESMYKAFLRAEQEDEAQYGFLRSNAALSIVIVTDELDCSFNNDFASIFANEEEGGNQVFWTNPDAQLPSSAVCFNAGVVCTGGPGLYDECHASNKDVDGNVDVADDVAVLHPVSRYTDFVQELEDQKQTITPDQEVLVALIAGVPVGYDQGQAEITYADASDQEQIDFGIGAGCVNNSVEPPATARPPVREREFAEAFEVGSDDRSMFSVCAEDFSPALDDIANAIRDQIRPSCMPACVADSDLVTAGVQPACALVQDSPAEGGGVEEIDIPPCDGTELPAGAEVCYVALVDKGGVSTTPSESDQMSEYCAAQGWNLEFRLVRAPGSPAPGGTAVFPSCLLSQAKKQDCPDLP
ncbi:MAG: VWA domain-containing protein [Deltaproteobacteria bacterium]|nr:VWA domain-containing protein [Nannocystaceae bacterium]